MRERALEPGGSVGEATLGVRDEPEAAEGAGKPEIVAEALEDLGRTLGGRDERCGVAVRRGVARGALEPSIPLEPSVARTAGGGDRFGQRELGRVDIAVGPEGGAQLAQQLDASADVPAATGRGCA